MQVVIQAADAELPQEKTDDSLADSKDKEPKVVIKFCAHFLCNLLHFTVAHNSKLGR